MNTILRVNLQFCRLRSGICTPAPRTALSDPESILLSLEGKWLRKSFTSFTELQDMVISRYRDKIHTNRISSQFSISLKSSDLSLFDFLCRENWRAQLMSLEGGAITYLEVQQQALHNTDNKAFVQWCAHRNLLERLDPPPQCECGMQMRLQKSKCFKDGVCFRCHFCGRRQSVRGKTWMADSNMTLRALALLLACWCAKKGIEETCNVTGASRATVMQRFREFRDYAEEKYRQGTEHPLGGNDRICQVDESLFGKAKYHVGRQLATQQWAVGAYDQENSRVAVEFAPDRTSESLLGFIASTVRIGTTIYTDQWRGYNGLPRIGYPHRTVNHSQEFVSDAGVHTQGIEGTWGVTKAWLRRRSAPQRTTLEGHVHEWVFRRNLAQDFARFWDLMNEQSFPLNSLEPPPPLCALSFPSDISEQSLTNPG